MGVITQQIGYVSMFDFTVMSYAECDFVHDLIGFLTRVRNVVGIKRRFGFNVARLAGGDAARDSEDVAAGGVRDVTAVTWSRQEDTAPQEEKQPKRTPHAMQHPPLENNKITILTFYFYSNIKYNANFFDMRQQNFGANIKKKT